MPACEGLLRWQPAGCHGRRRRRRTRYLGLILLGCSPTRPRIGWPRASALLVSGRAGERAIVRAIGGDKRWVVGGVCVSGWWWCGGGSAWGGASCGRRGGGGQRYGRRVGERSGDGACARALIYGGGSVSFVGGWGGVGGIGSEGAACGRVALSAWVAVCVRVRVWWWWLGWQGDGVRCVIVGTRVRVCGEVDG